MDKPIQNFGKVVMPAKKTKKRSFFKIPEGEVAVNISPILKTATLLFFGFLSGTFSVFGNFNPVGISCISALFGTGLKFYMVLVSVFLGYATSNVYGTPIYIIAICGCALIDFFIFSKQRNRYTFIPALAGAGCLLSGAVSFSVLNGLSTFILVRGVLEAICSVALSMIIKKGLTVLESDFYRYILGTEEILCAGTVLTIAMGALAIKGTSGFNLAMALGTALLLATSFKAGVQSVALAVVFGICLLFLQIGTLELFLMLCLASLLSGTFSQKKIYAVFGFLTGFIIPSFYLGVLPDKAMAITVGLGIFTFLVIPKGVLSHINTFQNHKDEFDSKDYFVRLKDLTEARLKNFAFAFGSLAKVFDAEELPREVTPKAASEIVDMVAGKVCESCSMSLFCWRSKNYDTYEGIHRLIGAVEKNGVAEAKDLTKWMSESCVKIKDILEAANSCGREYKNNLVWQGRLNESRRVLKEQLLCVEKIITDLGVHGIPQPVFYESTAKEIKGRLLKKGINAQKVYVASENKGGLMVSITKDSCFGNEHCKDLILPIVNSVIGRPFKIDSRCASDEDGECAVVLKEIKGYGLKTAAATIPKYGSEQSGDSYYAEETFDKKGVMVICDGMGSGREAAKESGQATELVKSFLRAGFPTGLTVKVLNSALASDASETYTTMDIFSVDLFSGEAEVIKNGGATVFVSTRDGIESIRSASLPMGVLKEWQGEVTNLKLRQGDIIIMVTDGVTEALGADDEFNLVAGAIEKSKGHTEKLASEILKMALGKNEGKAKDDMTVLVGKVC